MSTGTERHDLEQTERRVIYVVRGQPEADDGDEIDVASLLRRLWNRRGWVASTCVLVTLLALVYALLATPVYRAEAVLLPREDRGGLSLPGGLSSLGGLAGLAGIDLGGRGKQEPLGLLRSFGFVRRFVEKQDLTNELLAAGDARLIDPGGPADARKATEFFTRSILTVTEDPKSGLVTVAIEWRDPRQAAAWANALVAQLNEEMRQRALVDSETSLSYLTEQLEQTRNVALQQSLARLLEAEMQQLMLAKRTSEFAFRVIDEAQVPRLREWPKRTLIVIAGGLLGACLGVFVALMVDPLRRTAMLARARPPIRAS